MRATVERHDHQKSWLRNNLEGVPTSKMTSAARKLDGRRARTYRLTANIVRSYSLNGTNFTRHSIWSSRGAGAAKMSHRPTIVSLHVEARILLTTVAGRSSKDRMTEGIEHMVIETLLFIPFVVIVGAAVVKAYEWHQDVLYGPYMRAR
jgi:hypothetical protein